jgi:hypothetical protein
MTKRFFISIPLLIISVFANSTTRSDPFENTFDVIAAPTIYSYTWESLLTRLSPLCRASTRSGREQYKNGNVECDEIVHALSISIMSGPNISVIDATFIGAAKCDYMRKALIKNYGNPTTSKGVCNLDWRLPTPRGKPQRSVGMELSERDDKIYFSIGEEQGP